MNRKLLNGLLVAAISLGGVMSVTSCKDTDEDVYAELRDQDSKLKENLKRLEDLYNAINSCSCDWDKFLQGVKNADGSYTNYEQALNNYVKQFAAQQQLKWYLDQINGVLQDGKYSSIDARFVASETILKNLDEILNGKDGQPGLVSTVGDHTTAIAGITTAIDLENLKTLLAGWNCTLPEALKKGYDAAAAAAAAASTANANKALLEALLKGYEVEGAEAGTYDVEKLTGLLKNTAELAAKADSIAAEADSIAKAAVTQEQLTTELGKLTPRIKANEDAIKKIDEQILAMTGQLNKLITSIEIQQVKNPVFGTINTPLDLSSKMLIAYFGEAFNVKFPAVGSTANEYCGSESPIWITNADKAALGIEPETFDGVLYDGDKTKEQMSLGSVYMSVNPAKIDVTGATFELVNSRGVASPATLSALEKCDEEIMFGYSRANETEVPNGFYKSEALLPISKIGDVKMSLDENFKSNAKELLKGIRDRSVSDVFALAKLVADQFNNKLPALGVRAGWSYDEFDSFNEDGTPKYNTLKNATYSEFGMAATTFHPLSYKFLYGKNIKNIPTISPIEDFTFGEGLNIKMPDLTFDLTGISLGFEFSDIKINLGEMKLEATIQPITIYKTDADGNKVIPEEIIGTTDETTIYFDDFKEFEQKLSAQISAELKKQGAVIDQKFEEAMKTVQDRINEKLTAEMQKFINDINGQFDNLVDKIENKVNGYLGTVNNYIGKVNGFINRINRVLDDPNHYLQVTMLYSAGDGQLHQVSNSSTLPTMLRLAGGDGIVLHPTSYTAEMLVPSFRKYVAVTDVYKSNDRDQKNDQLRDIANADGYFNKVISGTDTAVALKLPAEAKGYTYEIVYSSLDYHGATSTRKFYISVE